MTDNELKLNELKEVNGGLCFDPLNPLFRNMALNAPVCPACKKELTYQPSKINGADKIILLCTDPNCANYNVEMREDVGRKVNLR
jgi:hypothetical protein